MLGLIAERCVNDSAREQILSLRPTADTAAITESLAAIEQLRTFREEVGDVPIADTRYRDDVEDTVESNQLLDAMQLVAVAAGERASRELKNRLSKKPKTFPRLEALSAALLPHDDVVHAVENAIDSDGRIKDDASPQLRSVRRSVQRAKEALRGASEKMTAGYGEGAYPTMMGSRYVLLVPRTQYHKRDGLVHATSQKGGSLYFEPFELVGRNNELETLLGDESAEERRILLEINAAVRSAAPDIVENARLMDEVDCLRAKAIFARQYRCASPSVSPLGEIRLVDARHPLLVRSLEKEAAGAEVVPLSLELRGDKRVLVITGPNAGGKTVTLKTVGTAALLFQAGLQVPCGQGTELPVFESVFVDIGDEQSIEASLSTFTSHLAHLGEMSGRANRRSLCLIDEIGDGTDPDEGAALAVATLERLVSSGAAVIATTHYGRIKTFALEAEGVGNASMAFEDTEGRPLYRLLQGIAGRSRGIETAKRTGFDPDIIARAEAYLGGEAFRLEAVLSRLEASHVALEQERESLVRRSAELNDLIERYTAKEAEFNVSKREANRRATLEAEELLRNTRREIERLVRSIRENQARKDVLRQSRAKLDSMLKNVKKRRETQPPASPPVRSVSPGDRVAIHASGRPAGRVIEVENDMATVEINNKRIKIDVKGLYMAPLEGDSPPNGVTYDVQVEPLTSTSLDVRGSDREQALEAVNRFVDRAVLSGVHEVRVIHGVGEGILARAIQVQLETDRRVESIRPGGPGRGGLGVTIVTLR